MNSSRGFDLGFPHIAGRQSGEDFYHQMGVGHVLQLGRWLKAYVHIVGM
jgi:hypothetical protein